MLKTGIWRIGVFSLIWYGAEENRIDLIIEPYCDGRCCDLNVTWRDYEALDAHLALGPLRVDCPKLEHRKPSLLLEHVLLHDLELLPEIHFDLHVIDLVGIPTRPALLPPTSITAFQSSQIDCRG